MNVSYTYIDGKAIIFDENGNQVPVEYYDNLDEVLIQENIVETIENKIKELGDIKVLSKKRFIPSTTICITIAILIAPIIINLISGINIYTMPSNPIFGEMSLFKFIVISSAITIVPLSLLLDINEHSIYNSNVNIQNAKKYELDFLKKQLVEEKQKINDLKNEKKKEKEDFTFSVVKVNNVEQLKHLKHYVELYYSLGHDIEKLYKYLENGTLEDKLSKTYKSEDIQLAKQFLEENGPKLIKRMKS